MKKWLVVIAMLALLVAHQDYWQWENTTLDFGFLPRGLTYHAVLSIAAAIVCSVTANRSSPQGMGIRTGCSTPAST